eukprot:6190776-Pleurochrysis_carterae.AAC.2
MGFWFLGVGSDGWRVMGRRYAKRAGGGGGRLVRRDCVRGGAEASDGKRSGQMFVQSCVRLDSTSAPVGSCEDKTERLRGRAEGSAL